MLLRASDLRWLVCLAGLLPVSSLSASTFLWAGGNTGNWGNSAEWSPNTNYPGSGSDDVAQFDNNAFFGGGGSLTLADVSGADASFTIGSISKVTASSGRNFNLNNTSGGVGKLIFSHSSGAATFVDYNQSASFTDNINVAIELASHLTATVSTNSGSTMTLRFTKTVSESGGARSLAKSGTGTLVLQAGNSYSGGTTVNAGTLLVNLSGTLGGGDVSVAGGILDIQNTAGAIDDLADVMIATGGIVNLAAGLNDTVSSLWFDGVQQVAGTYGSSASGAQYVSDTYFSGAGILTVIPEPASLALMGLGGLALLPRTRRR